MAKLTLTDVSAGTGLPTGAAANINANNTALEAALEKTLSRDGTGPNQMNADIDMNGNDLLNVQNLDVQALLVDGQPIDLTSGFDSSTQSLYVIPFKDTIGATEIQAAVDIVSGRGAGTVLLPDNYTYRLNGVVTIPTGVNLRGNGRAARGSVNTKGGVNIICTTANAQIRFGSPDTSCFGGWSGGFTINANDVAEQPLYIGKCAQRGFNDILVHNATSHGVVIEKAQNCTFLRFDSELNGGSGMVLDLGCGSNYFLTSEINSNGEYNVKFIQSAESADVYTRPTGNVFENCIIERYVDGMLGVIYHGAGVRNKFVHCAISSTDADLDGYATVKMRKDGSERSDDLYFDSCHMSGETDATTCFDLSGQVSIILDGRNYTEFHKILFLLSDDCNVIMNGTTPRTNTGVTTVFQNQPGGSRVERELIKQPMNFMLDRLAVGSTDIVVRQGVIGEAQSRFQMGIAGDMQWGSGSAVIDQRLFRSAPDGTASMLFTGPLRISQKPNALHFVNGTPGAGLGQNGHWALNVDAVAAGNVLWTKISGTWTAIL